MRFYGVPEKMTRRLAAAVIGSQSVVVGLGGLVAWGLAREHTAYLVVGVVLMLACIVAAGCLRRPWGVTLGWALQIATLASAVIVPMMFIVGLIFGALWITALVQGAKLDRLTREYEQQNARSTG